MTTLASLYVPARARMELTWFYKQAAAELGDASNFRLIDAAPKLQSHLDPGDAEESGHDLERLAARRATIESDHLLDLRQEARVKLRMVWSALGLLEGTHQQTIEAQYVDRQWPNMVSARFRDLVGIVSVSTFARSAFRVSVLGRTDEQTGRVVGGKGTDGLGPVVPGTKTDDGLTVSPNGRRLVIRQVALAHWLDDVCRHRSKEEAGLLKEIEAEIKSRSIGAHRAYASARGMLIERPSRAA